MARIRDAAREALDLEDPAQSLESLVRTLVSGGESREAISAELDALVAALQEAGAEETTEEEVVREVLDRLRGWCAPDARL